jgi:hypothetical protein
MRDEKEPVMDHPPSSCPVDIGLMWRGPAGAPTPEPADSRFHLIFAALEALGAKAVPLTYDEAAVGLRERLLALDGLLVWVDPISEAGDRSRLDPLLREVAAAGVWVSAHPDVIQKMGVKDVLYDTRALGWGVDTRRHATAGALAAALPGLLEGGPRVLKQRRGNGGIGVWKVSWAGEGRVEVLHARRGSVSELMTLEALLARMAPYFEDGGLIIDQPFQPRLPEGMIRCYVSGETVVGYGQQLIKALVPPPAEGPDSPEARPGPRIMHPPEAPAFAVLRRRMEGEWIPGLRRLLGIAAEDMPALWDADFLLGPRDAAGADSYVLCEINISSVAPYPDSAADPVAAWAAERAAARKGSIR